MSQFVSIEGVECIAASDKAILCVVDGDEVWLPLSQVSDDSEVFEKGSSGTLIITEWIAEQKGIA